MYIRRTDGERVPFESFSVSRATLSALHELKFTTTTPIQSSTLPHTLSPNCDVLACGPTGCGKTLSFLIPVVESLARERWTCSDGLHSCILSPTRELAMQTFDVLKNLAKYHSFTVGLVTGGRKGFREEQRGVVKTNCLVATPGRLLSHFEGTYGFHADDLRVFVIDEADKVLDLGFKNEIDRIVGYLPEGRQVRLVF